MWRYWAHLLCSFEPQFSKFWAHHFYLARYEIRWIPTFYADMTERAGERVSDREGQKGKDEIIYVGKLLLNEIRRCDSCKSKFQHPICIRSEHFSISYNTWYEIPTWNSIDEKYFCAFIHMNVNVAQSSDSCSVWMSIFA